MSPLEHSYGTLGAEHSLSTDQSMKIEQKLQIYTNKSLFIYRTENKDKLG